MGFKNQRYDNFYLLALSIWIAYMNIATANVLGSIIKSQIGYMFMSLLVVILILLKEYLNYHLSSGRKNINVYKFMFGILFIIMFFYVSKFNNFIPWISMLLLIISGRNVSLKKQLSVFCMVSGFILFAVIIGSFVGKVPLTFSDIGNGDIRGSLGFSYVTFPSQHFLFIVCSYLLIRSRKIKIYELVLLAVVTVWLYIKTRTTSPFIFGCVILIYDLFRFKIFKKRLILENNFLKNSVRGIFILAPIIVFALMYALPSNLFFFVDKLVNTRLSLALRGMYDYGITAFGQRIDYVGFENGHATNNYFYIDSSYVQSFIQNGWVFTVLALLIFTYCINWAIKSGKDLLVMVIVIAALHAMFDPQLFLLAYSPIVLLIGKFFDKTDYDPNWVL
ncbi:hypothetical protein [Limosilactobacillus ingluviei]|uniref:hypothetical protein n=1 Tax=Limosilactobacillus ingluviei TaxID=148604 RepID=UPI00195708B3|nr:hypothetical protein [Limosilactobacillus ingluviei]MBM6728233.1 hypothetical protein [Limosilactobacillus ingluviei]